MAAVARRKCSANLEVCRPPEVQCKPPLRQAAGTLWAMRAAHTTKNKVDSFLQSEKIEKNNFVSLKIK
jgi:hypothetical protein